MMLDMLAAVARKDYKDRRRRQAEGIEKAKKIGKYTALPNMAGTPAKSRVLKIDFRRDLNKKVVI